MLGGSSTIEYDRVLKFLQCHDSLLQEDKYIARSDYVNMIEEYASINTFFSESKDSYNLRELLREIRNFYRNH